MKASTTQIVFINNIFHIFFKLGNTKLASKYLFRLVYDHNSDAIKNN